MKVRRLIHHSLAFATVAVVAAAPNASAQGREIFEWTGRVDREVQVSMHDNQLETRGEGDTETGRFRSQVVAGIPHQDGRVIVHVLNGRGNAIVTQQPSAQNGYTTTVQIDDPDLGADDYRVAAYWRPYSNCDAYRGNDNGAYGTGNRRDRDRHAESRDRNRDNADDDDERNDGYNNRTNGYDSRDRRGDGDNRYCGDASGIGNRNGQSGAQRILHWSGSVDGELEIRMQSGRIEYRTLGGAPPTNIHADRGNMSPNRPTSEVFIAQNQGRGSVTVIQQPSRWNGYTTVIRVRDPQSGYGFYDFDVLQ